MAIDLENKATRYFLIVCQGTPEKMPENLPAGLSVFSLTTFQPWKGPLNYRELIAGIETLQGWKLNSCILLMVKEIPEADYLASTQ